MNLPYKPLSVFIRQGKKRIEDDANHIAQPPLTSTSFEKVKDILDHLFQVFIFPVLKERRHHPFQVGANNALHERQKDTGLVVKVMKDQAL